MTEIIDQVIDFSTPKECMGLVKIEKSFSYHTTTAYLDSIPIACLCLR